MFLRTLVLTILGVIWAAVLVLVGGRFFALLLGANTDSELIDRLYRHSDFWVKPFFGMFDLANKTVEDTGGVFEPASFIALAVYLIAGLLVIGLVSAVSLPMMGTSNRHAHES